MENALTEKVPVPLTPTPTPTTIPLFLPLPTTLATLCSLTRVRLSGSKWRSTPSTVICAPILKKSQKLSLLPYSQVRLVSGPAPPTCFPCITFGSVYRDDRG